MKIGKISKIIIFGGSRLTAEFAESLKKGGQYDFLVFSAKRHLDEVVKNDGRKLREIFERAGIKYFESKDINSDKNLPKEVTPETLGIAFGAAWIFSEKTAKLFKENYLLDFMGIDLPRYRGGAHYTWQILHGNRKGCANLQVIYGGEKTFHRGEILKRREYDLPKEIRKPVDFFNSCLAEESKFLDEFLKETKEGKEFELVKLNESESSYYPFLSTKENGLIDWSWRGEKIFLFISAFDDPYKGAATWRGNKKVYLKDCDFSEYREKFHPFTSGIIIRKDKEKIFVAVEGGLLSIRLVLDEKGKDLKNELELGERFYTPQKELEKARRFGAVYEASGLKKK